jgi:hypothetical protein
MKRVSTELLIFGGAGLISILAFGGLILAPAIGSFSRTWEKFTAAALSFVVLIALVGIGVGIGLAIVYYWPDISSWFD